MDICSTGLVLRKALQVASGKLPLCLEVLALSAYDRRFRVTGNGMRICS